AAKATSHSLVLEDTSSRPQPTKSAAWFFRPPASPRSRSPSVRPLLGAVRGRKQRERRRRILPAMSTPIPIYTVSIPEHTSDKKPNYPAIGRKLDQVIETHFPDRKMAIRCIGLIDHPGYSLEALVATILELGTDRYDPIREGVHYPALA